MSSFPAVFFRVSQTKKRCLLSPQKKVSSFPTHTYIFFWGAFAAGSKTKQLRFTLPLFFIFSPAIILLKKKLKKNARAKPRLRRLNPAANAPGKKIKNEKKMKKRQKYEKRSEGTPRVGLLSPQTTFFFFFFFWERAFAAGSKTKQLCFTLPLFYFFFPSHNFAKKKKSARVKPRLLRLNPAANAPRKKK